MVEFAVVDTEDVVDMIATGARLFLSLREREKHNEDGRRSVRLLLVLLGDVCLCCRYGTRPVSCDVFVPGRTNTSILERKRNVGRTK